MIIFHIAVVGGAVYAFQRLQRQRKQKKQQSSPPIIKVTDNVVEQPDKTPFFAKPTVRAGLVVGGIATAGMAVLLSPVNATALLTAISQSSQGQAIFTIIYGLSPLAMFPATFLSLAAGGLFGPVQGLLCAISGKTLAAMLGYAIGQSLEYDEITGAQTKSFIERYSQPLHDHPFVTLTSIRFTPMSYQVVSYISGFLQLPWPQYLIATLTGSFPLTIFMVLGGSVLAGYTVTSLYVPLLTLSGLGIGAGYLLARHLEEEPRLLELQPMPA